MKHVRINKLKEPLFVDDQADFMNAGRSANHAVAYRIVAQTSRADAAQRSDIVVAPIGDGAATPSATSPFGLQLLYLLDSYGLQNGPGAEAQLKTYLLASPSMLANANASADAGSFLGFVTNDQLPANANASYAPGSDTISRLLKYLFWRLFCRRPKVPDPLPCPKKWPVAHSTKSASAARGAQNGISAVC